MKVVDILKDVTQKFQGLGCIEDDKLEAEAISQARQQLKELVLGCVPKEIDNVNSDYNIAIRETVLNIEYLFGRQL